jgi:hypothetical protein
LGKLLTRRGGLGSMTFGLVVQKFLNIERFLQVFLKEKSVENVVTLGPTA